MADLKISRSRPKDGPKIRHYVLREELEKRRIAVKQFAQALDLTIDVVKGTAGDFPLEKLDQCVELLNNWEGPRMGQSVLSPNRSAVRLITKEMLLVS